MARVSKLAKAKEEALAKIKNPKLRQSAAELPKDCEVVYCGGDLSRDERETTICWTESSILAEITTSSPKWMRRLEKKGVQPLAVNIFDNCETRTYSVPKRYISYTQRMKKSTENAKKVED